VLDTKLLGFGTKADQWEAGSVLRITFVLTYAYSMVNRILTAEMNGTKLNNEEAVGVSASSTFGPDCVSLTKRLTTSRSDLFSD